MSRTVESTNHPNSTPRFLPEPTRTRTTGFIRVTTQQVTGATGDSWFVLVRTHQHGMAFQPQAMKLQGRVQRTPLRLSSHRMHVGVYQTYPRQCVRREDPKEDLGNYKNTKKMHAVGAKP